MYLYNKISVTISMECLISGVTLLSSNKYVIRRILYVIDGTHIRTLNRGSPCSLKCKYAHKIDIQHERVHYYINSYNYTLHLCIDVLHVGILILSD